MSHVIHHSSLWRTHAQLRGLLRNHEDIDTHRLFLTPPGTVLSSTALALHPSEAALAVLCTPLLGSSSVGLMPTTLTRPSHDTKDTQSNSPDPHAEINNETEKDEQEEDDDVQLDGAATMRWLCFPDDPSPTCADIAWLNDRILLLGCGGGRVAMASLPVEDWQASSGLLPLLPESYTLRTSGSEDWATATSTSIGAISSSHDVDVDKGGDTGVRRLGDWVVPPYAPAATTVVHSLQPHRTLQPPCIPQPPTPQLQHEGRRARIARLDDAAAAAAAAASASGTPTGRLIGAQNTALFLWDSAASDWPLRMWRPHHSGQAPTPVMFTAWAPGSDAVVLSGSYDGSLVLSDTRSSSSSKRNCAQALALGPHKQQRLLSSSCSSSSCSSSFSSSAAAATCGAFSSVMPHTVAAGFAHGQLALYDVRHAAHPLVTWASLQGAVTALRWVPGFADMLLSAGVDGSVSCWNMRFPPTFCVGRAQYEACVSSLVTTSSVWSSGSALVGGYGLGVTGELSLTRLRPSATAALVRGGQSRESVLTEGAMSSEFDDDNNNNVSEAGAAAEHARKDTNTEESNVPNDAHAKGRAEDVQRAWEWMYQHRVREAYTLFARVAKEAYRAGDYAGVLQLTDPLLHVLHIPMPNYEKDIFGQAAAETSDATADEENRKDRESRERSDVALRDEVLMPSARRDAGSATAAAAAVDSITTDAAAAAAANPNDYAAPANNSAAAANLAEHVVCATRRPLSTSQVRAEWNSLMHEATQRLCTTWLTQSMCRRHDNNTRRLPHAKAVRALDVTRHDARVHLSLHTVDARTLAQTILRDAADGAAWQPSRLVAVLRRRWRTLIAHGVRVAVSWFDEMLSALRAPSPSSAAAAAAANGLLRLVLQTAQEPCWTDDTSVPPDAAAAREDRFYRDMESAEKAVRTQLQVRALAASGRCREVVQVVNAYQRVCLQHAQAGVFDWLAMTPLMLYLRCLKANSEYVSFFWACTQCMAALTGLPSVVHVERLLASVLERVRNVTAQHLRFLRDGSSALRHVDVLDSKEKTDTNVLLLRAARWTLRDGCGYIESLMQVQLECENVAVANHMDGMPSPMRGVLETVNTSVEQLLEAWAGLLDSVHVSDLSPASRAYVVGVTDVFAAHVESFVSISAKGEEDERLNAILGVCDDFLQKFP